MSLIDWLPSYNTDIAEIDIDNQQLVSMINLLHDSIQKKNNHEVVNQVIRQLAQNYQDHRTITTEALQKINYNGIFQQQNSHKKFGRVLSSFLKRLKNDEKISAMELIGFLRNWFEKHILIEDKKIKLFLLRQKKEAERQIHLENSTPKKIAFEDLYHSQNPNIDNQHKELAELYNKLYRVIELKMDKTIINKILYTFKHHTELHFKDEELLMLDTDYSDYKKHSDIHRQLLEDFDTFMVQISENSSVSPNEILVKLRTWFIDHLANEDKKFFDFISKKKETKIHA